MANSTLEIVLTARDEASKVISGVAGKISSDFAAAEAASNQFAFGLAAAGAAAAGFIGYGAKVAGDLEASRQGFITLLGSADKADAVLAQIKKDAATTPFELPGLIQANQLLTSVTHNGQQSEELLMNVGKALAAMGKGQPELDRIIVNLQQIGAVGHASMLDIKQFAFAGIPIFDMLTKVTGKTGAALNDMISNGEITFPLLVDMFNKAGAAGGQFADAFKNQAGTFNQLVSNMADNFRIFLASTIQKTGVFDAMKAGIASLNDFMDSHGPQIQAAVMGMFGWIRDNGPLLAGILIGALTPAVIGFVGAWLPLLPYVAVGAALGVAVQALVGHFGGLSGVMVRLQPVIEAVRSILAGMHGFLVTWGPLLLQIAGTIGGILLGALKSLWQSLSRDLGPALVKLTPLLKIAGIALLALAALSLGGLIATIWLVIEAAKVLSEVISGAINLAAGWLGLIKHNAEVVQRGFSDLAGAAGMFFDLLTGGDPVLRGHGQDLVGLAKALAGFRDGIENALAWLATLPAAVATAVSQTIAWFKRLPGEAWGVLTTFFLRDLPYDLGFGLGLIITLVPRMVQAFVTEMQALPGQVAAIWTQVATTTSTWLSQIAALIVSVVSQAVTTTINWFAQLPGQVCAWLVAMLVAIGAALSALPGLFAGWLATTYNVVTTQLVNTGNQATLQVASWSGRIGGALASIPGVVGGIFASMKNAALGEVNSLWNGLVTMWDRIKAIFGQIADAFNKGLSAGQSIGKALHLPGYAAGTSSAAGGLALVGEQGPELVAMPRGAQVIPNGQSRQILQSGGSPLVSIGTVNNYTQWDPSSWAKDVGFQIALRT